MEKNYSPKKYEENTCYIDGTNLHKGIQGLGKNLDYKKFKQILYDKFRIKEAYIFMGYIENQKQTYEYLKNCGFKLIFKESIIHRGVVKGNADGEMILKSVEDFYEKKDVGKVVLVTGDGDFSCLIDFLVRKGIFKSILIPNKKYSSYLIRKKKNISIIYGNEILEKIT